MLQFKNTITCGIILLLLCVVLPVFAQRHERGDVVKRLKNKIELTTAQENQIQNICATYQPQMETLRTTVAESGEWKEIKELRRAQRTEILAVLTPEQRATLQTKRKGRAEQREKWQQLDRQALKKEVREYRQQNIRPFIKAQRTKMEAEISAADRATLVELRPVFKKIRKAQKERNGDRSASARTNQRERVAALRAMEQKYAPELATLKNLVQKYEPQITALRAEMEPQVQRWSADTKAIIQRYLAAAGIDRTSAKRTKKQRHFGQYLMGEHAQMRFLLLRPTAADRSQPGRATTDFSIYPNPLVDEGQVTYTVKNAGQVRLEVRDEAGNVQQVIINEHREPGNYTAAIALNNMPTGAYYLVVTDANGTTAKPLVVVK